jgi:hypothetical protein
MSKGDDQIWFAENLGKSRLVENTVDTNQCKNECYIQKGNFMSARNWVSLCSDAVYFCDLETEMTEAIMYLQSRLDGVKLRYPDATSVIMYNNGYDDYFELIARRLETDEEYKSRLDKLRQQAEKQKLQALAKRKKKEDAKDKEIAELKARIERLENEGY